MKAMSDEWDPINKCVVSATDRLVDDLMECDLDDEFDFPDTDTQKFEVDISAMTKEQEKASANQVFGKGQLSVNPYDSDSVSTMVSRHNVTTRAAKKNDGGKINVKESEKSNKEKQNVVDKSAVAATITGKIQQLEWDLARVLGNSSPSLQLGQAVENEVFDVGDGNASGGRSA